MTRLNMKRVWAATIETGKQQSGHASPSWGYAAAAGAAASCCSRQERVGSSGGERGSSAKVGLGSAACIT